MDGASGTRQMGDGPVRKRSWYRNSRIASGSSIGNGRIGIRYPPLPKWMEKLPGNRKRSGKRVGNGKVRSICV